MKTVKFVKRLLSLPTALVFLFVCGFSVACNPSPAKIALSVTEVLLHVGEAEKISAVSSDGAAITWSSSDEAVISVTADGTVTAVGEGEALAIAASPKAMARCKVTVEKPSAPPTAITLSHAEISLVAGEQKTLVATASDGGAIAWSSDNLSVATVKGGTVTAVSEGTANITAACGAGKAVCTVTVTKKPAPPPEFPDPAPTVTVAISQTALTLNVGSVRILSATASDGGAVTWTSDRPAVASVQNGTVTALSSGTAKITATSGKANAVCTVTVTAAPQPDPSPDEPKKEGYTLVFHDEFTGDALDRSKWNYQNGIRDNYYGILGPEYWGNGELQYYTENAVTVSDGTMKITARKQNTGDRNYTSGRIVTRDLHSFTYGYFEAKMKLPAVHGMWPAFWLLPQPTDHTTTNNVYGGWATNGEIDIMEARGNAPDEICGTIHHGGAWPNNTYDTKWITLPTPTSEWHTYAVEWTADEIVWYYDDVAYFSMPKEKWRCGTGATKPTPSAPFDQPFYILFNLAVDGGHFNAGAVPANFTSAAMEVDFVRVYRKS